MLRDTANILKNVLNVAQYISERHHYQAIDEIKVKVKRRLVLFLFPHLHRMARLTDNFSTFIKSHNVARYLIKTLCKFAYLYTTVLGELANLINEDWDVQSASLELGAMVLQIEYDIVMLKTIDCCIRQKER